MPPGKNLSLPYRHVAIEGPIGVGKTSLAGLLAKRFSGTEMLEDVPEKVLAKIRAQIPVGRLCHPEEIARVVHFLAADASAYITGQVWGVNGGLDM